MNQSFFTNPTKDGYIIIPRSLLKQVLLNREKTPMCDEEAFLVLLFQAYYYKGTVNGIELQRGEINGGADKWSKIFNWSDWKVRHFFNSLQDRQIISKRKQGRQTIIRIEQYDLYCANKKIVNKDSSVKFKNKNDELFDKFWQEYHDLSGVEPVDKGKAERVWKKLTLREKNDAIDAIYPYVMRTSKIIYIKNAANFLADRTFEDYL